MPRLSLADLLPALRCPRCTAPLNQQENALRCGNGSCDLADEVFPVEQGLPLLVDYSDSIAEPPSGGLRTALKAPWQAKRAPRAKGIFARWQRPTNRVAAVNVQRLLRELRHDATKPPRILIVGGASVGNGIETLYHHPTAKIAAFDIVPSVHCQFVADAHRIPIAEGNFDAVIIQAVLEHVLDPVRVVTEIHRVLGPRGVVYAETPFMQQVHEGPFDFHRFSHSGHRWLFRRFEEIDSGVVAGPGTALQWAVDHAIRASTGSTRLGMHSRTLTRPLVSLERRLATERRIDGACAVYFLGRRSDSSISPRDMIRYYAGAQRELC